jgi:hypothetical protein
LASSLRFEALSNSFLIANELVGQAADMSGKRRTISAKGPHEKKNIMRWKNKDRNKERVAISRVDLEKMIANTVRASNPACSDFVTVVLSQVIPSSRQESNWAVRGIKYGKADRRLCDAALSGCMAEMQVQYQLYDQKS